MKNITDKQLHEQDTDNLGYELGMQMSSLGPIPKTKKQSSEVIKRIFNSSNQPFYGVGENISLDSDLKKLKDKIRFFEYGKSFHSEKEGRGFNFEGMLAGLFNGTAIVGKAKEDIVVDGVPYSVKSAEPPNPSFDSGTLIPGLIHIKKTLEVEFKSKESAKGIEYTSTKETKLSSEGEEVWAELEITTPLSLLEKGEEYNQYKEIMLDFSFRSGNGKPLSWIFAIIYPNSIQYTVWSSEDLITSIINDGEDVVGVGRAPLKDIRLKSSYLFDNGTVRTIQFPSFTPEELKKLRYNKGRGLKVDKIAELFGKYKTKVRYDVLEYIRKNPQTFLKRVVSLYGDKLGPMLKEKGYVELNESTNYDDVNVQNLIIDILYEGVCDDHDKGALNIKVNEGTHKGNYGHVFSDKIPLELDNKLYVLTNKLGGLTHTDITRFIEKTNKESLYTLQGLLSRFPSTLEELLYYYGSLDSLRNSDEYKRIVNLVKRVGSGERIMEDSDVFGQGLLDPIDSEEFDGDDEEWEELVGDVENDESEDEVKYQYSGGKTDAEKGFVAPSNEVTDNICNVEGFCSAQGPITFGQLRKLVEEATNQRILGDMGRGVFKTLWRIVPFFIPQVLLAAVGITVTRAINKIITPALKDTRGYKSWWGKVVLKAMDVAEGDYIPDVAIGDDPLSKIFFVSDGLLQMIRDKYKLKFARYVAEVASNEPDDKPVPEWFVENLLRDYLNQKFLLDPPLQIKKDIEVKELGEDLENWGYQDNKIGVLENFDGDSRIQQTINKYLDSEYEVRLRGYPDKEVMRFESKRSGEILSPRLIIREINQIFGSAGSDGIKQYLQYMVYLRLKGETNNINFQIDEDRTPNYPGSPDSFRSLHRDRVNDDKLQIPPATLVNYLDKFHREKLIKELTEILKCIAYNCYGGWANDPENENPDNTDWMAEEYCEECSEELIDRLQLLDREVAKMGFVKTGVNEFEFTGVPVPRERRRNDYPVVDVLEKPFPFTYNDWLENIIQEVDPKFYINKKDDIVYMEESVEAINEHKGGNNLNPDVEEGDVVELIHMDDPWGISPMTRGVVMGFEDMGPMGEKILVKWIIYNPDNDGETFRNLPLIKDVDYWRIANPLTENINEENQTDLDLERFGNILVRAYFNYSGGWGQPPKRFVVYITPSGIVKGVSLNQGMSNREVPFKEGDRVELTDLIKFEENSKFDLQMKGRIREGLIKEQTLDYDELTKMTKKTWTIIQIAIKTSAVSNVEANARQFLESLKRYFEMSENDAAFLWLVVVTNANYKGISVKDLVKVNYTDIKVPELWETEIEYLDDYNEDESIEECVDGHGEESGDECECLRYEELEETTTDEDGEKSEEWVDCQSANKDTLEKYAYGTADDCECEEWVDQYYKVYYYPIRKATIVGVKDLADEMTRESNELKDYHEMVDDFVTNSEGTEGLVMEDDHYDDNYDEGVMWDYFTDNEQGKIEDIHSDDLDTSSMMHKVNSQFYNETKNLQEQDGEQLKMFTTGQWNFPVNGLEETDMKDLKVDMEHALPEPIVTKIFKRWDEKGIDFSILKLLGIDKGFAFLQTMLLKRYLQFTNTPIPVSHTFDCEELKDLFNTDSQDYNMDYVQQYLCGNGSFWDSEDWYHHEWDDYMTDAIDENNWKTICDIFGGVSQSDAEDMLNKVSSTKFSNISTSEEVDELTEKYDEQIDDIRHHILWANADESESVTKRAMAEDIEYKINEHFDGVGRLMRDNEGSFSYTIDGDLRNYVEDKWDNAEDVFEYHNDYVNQTLEDVIIDLGKDYMKPDVIFQLLMDEEYRFWDYCEGKRGECLTTEQKFFDGYWHPSYDINEGLADRLGEVWYEPREATEPIQEQDWVVPDDVPQKDAAATGPKLDKTPFTNLDVKILNRLATMFDRETLTTIWEEDDSQLASSLYGKYEGIMKLYGETSNKEFSFAKSTRFAKWADDNWDEAERIKEIGLGNDFDPTITYNLDFGLVTQPVKEWPHQYEVAATESYWAKEYKYGSTYVAGYSQQNVKDKANSAWWDWDVDMEYGDQGDTDDHELEVDTVQYHSTIKEARMQGLIFETGMLKEMEFDRYELLKLAKNTKGGVSGGRGEVFRFLENLRDSGLVNMFQATDFLWSGKEWLRKFLDFKHPERLEDPDENIQYLLDNAGRMRDVLVIILMDRADREGKTPDLDNMNREMRPLAQDLVKIWAAQI